VIRGCVIVVAVVIAAAGSAVAYPHFQLTSETSQCSQCHVGPAGGGLLTAWGREEFADAIANGGDPNFLHGLVTLPEALQLGGNVRLAALANDVGATEGVELAAFPMQVDLAARIARGAWSIVGSIGARGRVRGSEASLADYVISREHFIMWQPDPSGPYVRAGRFAAPYGLRLADHTAFVRRYLGFNLLEETYNLAAGWSGADWEVHATAFVYDPLQGGPREELGGAVMFEKQASDAIVVGASGRASVGGPSTRLQSGVHGKLWLADAKLLWQAEVHGVREMFDDGAGDRWQLAAYAGPVLVPMRGIYAGLGYQAFAQDLEVRSVTRHAGDAWVSYFPRAHFEVMASARAQWIGPTERAYLALLQLHYAL